MNAMDFPYPRDLSYGWFSLDAKNAIGLADKAGYKVFKIGRAHV